MRSPPSGPPIVAAWLVGAFLPAAHREAMLGDLLEEYEDIRALTGSTFTAKCWFWSQAGRSLPIMSWSVVRTEGCYGFVVASLIYATVVGLKMAADRGLAGILAGHATAEVIAAPATLVLLAALGGCIAACIRYRAVITLAAMITLSVAALILINGCPIPVPWWYRFGFLLLAPFATLGAPAMLRLGGVSHMEP